MGSINTPKKRRKAEPQFIKVGRVTNPFEPMRDVRNEQWKWRKSYVLADYMPVGETADQVVSHNGHVITRESFGKVKLQPGDFIVIYPVPRGGGGGSKGILRIVGMIVVAVAAASTGAAPPTDYAIA